jgi:hypothetical protein
MVDVQLAQREAGRSGPTPLTVFVLLSSFFCTLGAAVASTTPKGSVWLDHLASGQSLLSGQVPTNPTYPLWGYSLLAATLSDQLVWVQAVLAILVSGWWFALVLKANPGVGSVHGVWFPALVAVGLLPWFALATTYFSNSITIVLALLAACLLWQAEMSGRWPARAALAGLMLGLAANIRSEFVVIACLLGVCVFVYSWRVQRASLRNSSGRAIALVAPVLLAMLPWAVYSQATTGEFSFKSTNSGAVAYLGLGSLRANPWNVQPKDEFVDQLAKEAVGARSAWTPAADKHFSRLYRDAIRQEPAAFARRVVNGWRVMVLQGLYLPNLRQAAFDETRDQVLAGLAVERMKAALSLGVDLYALDRARSEGVDLSQLQARHFIVIALESTLRVLGVMLFIGMLLVLAYRFFMRWPYTFAGWVAAAFTAVVVIVAGLIQTSPRHSTLLLPIILGALLMGQSAAPGVPRSGR